MLQGQLSAGRIAALTSTVSAIAKALSVEVDLEGFEGILTDATTGKVLVYAVQANDETYSVVIVSRNNSLLRTLICRTKWCVGELTIAIGSRTQAAGAKFAPSSDISSK